MTCDSKARTTLKLAYYRPNRLGRNATFDHKV